LRTPSTAAEEYQPTAVTSWTLAQLDRMAVIVIDFCRPTAHHTIESSHWAHTTRFVVLAGAPVFGTSTVPRPGHRVSSERYASAG